LYCAIEVSLLSSVFSLLYAKNYVVKSSMIRLEAATESLTRFLLTTNGICFYAGGYLSCTENSHSNWS